MSIMQFVGYTIVLMLVLELLLGWHRQIYRKQDCLVTGGCFLLNYVTRPVAAACWAGLFSLVLPAYKGALSGLPLLPSVIVLFLVAEFAFYWVHRMAHNPLRHKLLFGLHQTHHSAKYLNVTVMARINIFWTFVVPYVWVVGLAVYLGLGAAGMIVLGLVLFWNAFTHSALRWDDALAKSPWGNRLLTVIEWFFITPRIHHTHHGYGKDGKSYKNFAVATSLWDRLFGTLHIPQGRPARYGLPYRDRHWLEEIMFPLYSRDRVNRLLARVRRAERLPEG